MAAVSVTTPSRSKITASWYRGSTKTGSFIAHTPVRIFEPHVTPSEADAEGTEVTPLLIRDLMPSRFGTFSGAGVALGRYAGATPRKRLDAWTLEATRHMSATSPR